MSLSQDIYTIGENNLLTKKSLYTLIAISLLLTACIGPGGLKQKTPTGTVVPATTKSIFTGTTPLATPAEANCTVVSRISEPDPTQSSVYPPLTDKDYIQGPASAKVTFLEYGDFQ